MRTIVLMLLACHLAGAGTRQYLRQIHVDKNSGLTAPPVEPGTVLDDKLVETLANTERELLKQKGYRDPAVTPEILPVSYATVDLHLHSDPGPRTVVTEVRFTGNPVLPEPQLRHALEATRIRRLWRVLWISHPPYADDAVGGDVEHLRSFYYGLGYFDADVGPGGVEYDGTKAIVIYRIDAGRHYDLPKPVSGICQCLLDARRQAEIEGRPDFRAGLQIEPEVLPHIQAGEPVYVGRIEFTGNHHVSDKDVRRALTLQEGALFDRGSLRQSLLRINQLGFFDPVTADQVQITPHADERTADITVSLHETKKRRWSISGPVGPPSFAGDLEGSIAMRLPAATWFASGTWVAFNPIARFIPFLPRNPLIPIASLSRPLIPTLPWTTGFSISPQLGWQGMLAGYAATHIVHGAKLALGLNRAPVPELAIPVQSRPGYLVCKPPKPMLWWARGGAGMALDFVARSYLPGAF